MLRGFKDDVDLLIIIGAHELMGVAFCFLDSILSWFYWIYAFILKYYLNCSALGFPLSSLMLANFYFTSCFNFVSIFLISSCEYSPTTLYAKLFDFP